MGQLNEKNTDNFTPVLRFAVLSDTHFCTPGDWVDQLFPNVINTLYRISDSHPTYKNLDAIAFSGDLVSFGIDSCYAVARAALDKCIRPETQLIACMGNHELMESFENGVTFVETETAIDRFKAFWGYDNIDNHFVIKGYHFILSSLLLINNEWMLNRNRDWMKEQLEAAVAHDPNRPIFTFSHFPVKNTTTYTAPEFQYYLNVPRTEDLYVNYPQVVNFFGHSHTSLTYPNIISQQEYTNITAGSLEFVCAEFYNEVTNGFKSLLAHNLIIEVDADHTIRIFPYDFSNDVLITPAPIEIKNPADRSNFIYTPDYFVRTYKAPEFDKGAKIQFSQTDSSAVKYTFDQAVSYGTLANYYCQLQQDGKPLKHWRLNAYTYYGYLGKAPTTISDTIENLPAGNYTLTIIPVDSFNKHSPSQLSASFTVN